MQLPTQLQLLWHTVKHFLLLLIILTIQHHGIKIQISSQCSTMLVITLAGRKEGGVDR